MDPKEIIEKRIHEYETRILPLDHSGKNSYNKGWIEGAYNELKKVREQYENI